MSLFPCGQPRACIVIIPMGENDQVSILANLEGFEVTTEGICRKPISLAKKHFSMAQATQCEAC